MPSTLPPSWLRPAAGARWTGSPFWKGLLDWMNDTLVAHGTVSAADMELIRVIDDPDEVVNAIFDFYQQRGFYATSEERQLNLQL